MFAATLLRKRPAMQPEASPADNAQADTGDAPSAGRSSRRAARFQYGTGDKPLNGYTIKRGIGRGGFGEVYFATSDAGKEVALKLIRRNLDVELRGVTQCLNLKHPNLVSLYDLRSDEADDQWVVMEYIGGDSLEDVLERSPKGLPVEDVVAWLRGIAAGVAYLHSSGIVHRDLKPGNIYLERGAEPIEQRVRIGDYGLSKFISASRRSGQTESVGTVHYMAPEIAGGRYGREIDTYALGVIVYEMLTGNVPFEGESVGEVLMKHLTAEPDLRRIAEPYRSIVSGALAKDPEARLATVDEMTALLPSAEPAAEAAPAPALPRAQQEVWSPVSRPPHTDHPTPPREPLWQGLVELTDTVREGWRAWHVPPLGKGLVLFGTVAALLSTAAVWLPTLAGLFAFYCVYYIVWAGFLQGSSGSPVAAPSPASPKPSTQRATQPYNWRAAAVRQREARSGREKAISLTGSMLGSAAVSIVGAIALTGFVAGEPSVDPLRSILWMASVATLGSWGVLASSHALNRFEDWAPRRGLLVLTGAAVGLAAYGLAETLNISLLYNDSIGPGKHDYLLKEMLDVDLYANASPGGDLARVPVAASVAYFVGVFLLVRWWKSADYVRRSRIGLWSIAATVLAAFGVQFITWYPQPVGMALMGLIALAVQMSSPWCPPSRREALARGAVGGINDE